MICPDECLGGGGRAATSNSARCDREAVASPRRPRSKKHAQTTACVSHSTAKPAMWFVEMVQVSTPRCFVRWNCVWLPATRAGRGLCFHVIQHLGMPGHKTSPCLETRKSAPENHRTCPPDNRGCLPDEKLVWWTARFSRTCLANNSFCPDLSVEPKA